MDQNQLNADDELQKAINEISGVPSVDPTFSDPIAAPSTLPEGGATGPIEPVGPFPAPELEIPDLSTLPGGANAGAPAAPAAEAPAAEVPQNIKEVKSSALKDLLPMLDRLDIDASKKFYLCREGYETFGDSSVLEIAYRVAKEIADEKERADALLYVVETIDKID